MRAQNEESGRILNCSAGGSLNSKVKGGKEAFGALMLVQKVRTWGSRGDRKKLAMPRKGGDEG